MAIAMISWMLIYVDSWLKMSQENFRFRCFSGGSVGLNSYIYFFCLINIDFNFVGKGYLIIVLIITCFDIYNYWYFMTIKIWNKNVQYFVLATRRVALKSNQNMPTLKSQSLGYISRPSSFLFTGRLCNTSYPCLFNYVFWCLRQGCTVSPKKPLPQKSKHMVEEAGVTSITESVNPKWL